MTHETPRRRAYVETYGCQMNISDGELMEGILAGAGYEIVSTPEEADVVLVNTCAIREHAEKRVLGRVAQLKALKLERPGTILGVTGCMAQRMGAEIAQLRAGPAAQQSKAERPPAIVLDAAILLEAGWDALCDEVWVVVARPETALARLMARDGLGREEATARLDAQMSNEARMARAGQVIHNDGSLEELRAQVKKLWRARTAGRDPAC